MCFSHPTTATQAPRGRPAFPRAPGPSPPHPKPHQPNEAGWRLSFISQECVSVAHHTTPLSLIPDPCMLPIWAQWASQHLPDGSFFKLTCGKAAGVGALPIGAPISAKNSGFIMRTQLGGTAQNPKGAQGQALRKSTLSSWVSMWIQDSCLIPRAW